ncbi:DUF4390 domain-containing protein [Desulfocurvus sp. DL9XJH121]
MNSIFCLPRLRAISVRACAALAGLALCLCAALAVAGDMELGGLVLDNEAGDISVRFGVRLTGYESLVQELDAGSSVALRCKAQVHRRKDLWLDKREAVAQVSSVLSKDLLADEYVLTMPGEEAPRRSKILPALLSEAWGAMSVDLGPWKGLEPGNEYTLDLSISMDRTDVPVWLRYVLFFWSFDVYPTVSYQLEFTY